MSTATATMTDTVPPAAPTWTWTARPSLKDYQKALDELHAINQKHIGWNDHLSKRLHRWCSKVISTPIKDQATAFAQAEKFLERLSTKILVNPFHGNFPLLSPMLDRTWTWEEWTLSDYVDRTKRKDSPYDGQAIDAKPHLFARAMIAWLRGLRIHEPIKSPWDYLIPRIPDGPDVEKVYFKVFQLFAKSAISLQKTREMQYEAEEAEKDYEVKAKESEARTKVEVKKNADRLEKIAKTYKEGMAANKKAHKEETERVIAKQQELREKQEKLEKEKEKMKEQIAKHEQEIARLALENVRRRQEIAALNARLDDDGGCPIM